jgi:hypothetical protein
MPKYYATLQSQTDEHKRYVTMTADSKKDVRDHLEAREAKYVAFRLDDQKTLDHYPTLPQNALAIVNESCQHVQEDTHLLDGRFVRAGKVLGQNKLHRGWLHLHLQEKPYRVVEIGQVDKDGPQAAVTAGQFGIPIKNLLSGANLWDWDTDTIKCSLHTSTYTPDIDAHDFFNDCTNEITGTGYTAGGATLTASAPTYDTATDQVRLDAADTTWTTSTLTARIAIVYKSTGTASTSPLISFVNFGADVSTTAGTFQITWDATGIFIIDIT